VVTNSKNKKQNKNVLVCVLPSKRDQNILLNKFWYRIPKEYTPKHKFTHLALYQPAVFGKYGKRIEYYAQIKKSRTVKRIDLLPKEKHHPRALVDYAKYDLAWVKKLAKPIKNIIPRRVSFGFTSLRALKNAGDILELYGVAPTEQIVEKALLAKGIKVLKEQTISKNSKRYRIDLAIICKNGFIAIECDNTKAHSGKIQKAKDKAKDKFLKRIGWQVVRLSEEDIIEHLNKVVKRIIGTIVQLGGLSDSVTMLE
jgi:very-short-patch-repair endonuclease